MAHILTDDGEELMIKHFWTEEATKPASFSVGLYNDATDAIAEGDGDPAVAITTEPGDGNYGRITRNFGATDQSTIQVGGDWATDIADLVFDVTNTTGTVDSWFIVVNVQLAGDAGAVDHIVATGSLGGSYDMAAYTEFTVNDAGISLS